MIKINLASKKRAPALQGAADSKVARASLLDQLGLNGIKMSGAGAVPLRSIAIAVGVVAAAYFFLDMEKREQIEAITVVIAKENAQQAKLRAEFEKTKGYQKKKEALERDEKILRIKIDTIKKLTNERDVPPRLLRELAENTPQDLWFSGIELDEDKKAIVMKGLTYDEASVSAFNRALGGSALVTGAEIKETGATRDATGTEIFAFTIEARRK